MNNLSRRRAHARHTARESERFMADQRAERARERAAEAEEIRERRRQAAEAEAARERLTLEDLRGATHVRTAVGWHKVVRVNAKTVTVETGYSWTDRYAHGKILEARILP